MKKIEYFFLPHCPHCKNADAMIEKLQAENPQYRNVEFAKVDEKLSPLYAEKFDYFYVPSFFLDGVKLHEGVPTLEKIEAVLKAATE